MNPVDIQILGDELAIKWDDGQESYLRLETLRRACPCAGCKGEMDVMGQLHTGPGNDPISTVVPIAADCQCGWLRPPTGLGGRTRDGNLFV